MSRYACVAAQKAAGFPVTAACEVAEVSGFVGPASPGRAARRHRSRAPCPAPHLARLWRSHASGGDSRHASLDAVRNTAQRRGHRPPPRNGQPLLHNTEPRARIRATTLDNRRRHQGFLAHARI